MDEEGHRYIMLDEIVDHRKNDEAVDKQDAYVTNNYGRRSRKCTHKVGTFLLIGRMGPNPGYHSRTLKSRTQLRYRNMLTLVALQMSQHSHGGFHLH